jgi:hypothetical protein
MNTSYHFKTSIRNMMLAPEDMFPLTAWEQEIMEPDDVLYEVIVRFSTSSPKVPKGDLATFPIRLTCQFL